MQYLFGDPDIAAQRLKVLAEVFSEPTRKSSRSPARIIKAKWMDNQTIIVDGDLSENIWQATETDEIAAATSLRLIPWAP